MNKQQSGFTLIELIAVIVVLGILAATAIPKFTDVSSQARASSIQGLQGAVRGGMNNTYMLAALSNIHNTATGTVAGDGGNITIIYGYPTANAAGIGSATTVGAADYATSSNTGANTFTWSIAAAAGTCEAVYLEAVNDSTDATVTIDTSGC